MGLQLCQLDTTAPVGSVLEIEFYVYDSDVPALTATVARKLTITDPCDAGQYLCDGTCSAVECSLLGVLGEGANVEVAD